MNPGGFFLYIEVGDLCAERVTIHGPAEKRSSANSNTLRDAQKRQKTPLIVVENLLFIASSRATRDFRAKYARKYLAEYGP